MLSAAVTTLGSVVTGMMVGDAMGAIPMKSSSGIPATSHSATTKTTANGKTVASTETPRQLLLLGGFYVVAAMAVLFGGSKFLKDARIG